VETGREVRSLEGHVYNVIAVAISPDGRRAISGNAYLFVDGKGKDNTLRVWDLDSGKELHRYEKLFGEGGIYSLAYSPDGRRALVGGQANHALVLDLESGKEVFRLNGHTGAIKSVAVFSDGRYALTGSADGTVRLWGLPK
jgi:WD40 repeat protein